MHLAEKSSALKNTSAEGGEPQLEDNRREKKLSVSPFLTDGF